MQQKRSPSFLVGAAVASVCWLLACAAPRTETPPAQQRVAPMAIQVKPSRLPPPGNVHFVGPSKCKKCHPVEYSLWAETKHATSLAVLEQLQQSRSPQCLRCHTTGFAVASGYIDKETTPELGAVTCESCHGPGSAHVALQSGGTQVEGYGNVDCASCEVVRICILCHRGDGFDAKRMLKAISCKRRKGEPKREE